MVQTQPDPQPVIPLEVIGLAEATRAYLEVLRCAMPAMARMGERGAFLRDQMDAASKPTEPGTPASIGVAVRDLLEP